MNDQTTGEGAFDFGSSPLPPGWCWTTLGELLDGIEAGKSFKCLTRQAGDDEWGVIKVSAMTWGEFDEKENKAIPPDKEIEPQYEIRPGDLLLSRSNTVELVGATVLVRTTRPKLLLSDKSMRLLVPNEVNRAWLHKMLSSTPVRKQLSAVATGTSDSMRNVSQEKVLAVRLPVPPPPEQHRIVARIEELLSQVDAGVAALERVRTALRRYRAAVLKSAVEGRLTEAWRAAHPDPEPGSALLQHILSERRRLWEEEQQRKYRAASKEPPKGWKEKYSSPVGPPTGDLPPLPNGWCWATVEQISRFAKYGSSAKTSEDRRGVPVLRMGNIQDGSLDLTQLKYLPADHSEFPDLYLQKGDLLFNRTNSAELVGKSAVYHGTPSPCSYASYLIAVRMLLVNPETVCYFINSSHGRRWVASVVSQQVGQANVNGTKLLALAVPLPPVEEQAQIVAEVESRLSIVDKIEAQVESTLKRAARLRQSVLKMAFEGRLVPQDPADEPADLLMGRIRQGRAERNGSGPRQQKRTKQRATTGEGDSE